MNRHFIKEKRVPNKHEKTLDLISEKLQFKTTMGHHFILTRMAKT